VAELLEGVSYKLREVFATSRSHGFSKGIVPVTFRLERCCICTIAGSYKLEYALSCQLCSWLPDAARLWLTHGCMLDKRHLRPCAKWDVVLQTRLSRLFMHVVTVGCGRWGLLQRRKFQLIWKPESISTGHLPDVSVLCAGCDISGDNAASWPVCCTSCH
jgi:hypothetical protein